MGFVLRKLRLAITGVALCVLAPGRIVSGFDALSLSQNSDIVVSGTIEHPNAQSGNASSHPATSAKDPSMLVRVDGILKAKSEVPSEITVHCASASESFEYRGNCAPSDGSYMILFLKAEGDSGAYTFTSQDYPGVLVEKGAAKSNNRQLRDRTDEDVSHEIVEQMCGFAESKSGNLDQRIQTLMLIRYSKDPIVHDTAARLVRDPNPKLHEMALIILLRAKDASFLPIARKEILDAVQFGRNDGASNLILAVTQEFPASESVPIIAGAANASDAELRRTVAYAARSTRSPGVIPVLLPMVDDTDGEVAWNAMHSLGELVGHLDWRPTSHDPVEWQRCLNLWHAYANALPAKASR
jgi:hypothetical protein